MISYTQALTIIENSAPVQRKEERIPANEGLGRVLSQDVVSRVANPPFRCSAMDGFALVAADTLSASPDEVLSFRVLGTLAAGEPPQKESLKNTNGKSEQEHLPTAVEIMTGAALPTAYDSVVRLEDSKAQHNNDGIIEMISLERPVVQGANIREAGEDFNSDCRLIAKGTSLQSSHVMLCHASGTSQIRVHKQPKIGIVSTGAELVECQAENPEATLPPGMIFNSCAPYLLSSIPRTGATCKYYGTVNDDKTTFAECVENMINDGVEVIISTGAVSKGRFDFVPEVVRELGAEILFHKAAIRPGKPILFAQSKIGSEKVAFFCLPGNPVAAIVGLRFFVEPYIRKILGRNPESSFSAILGNRVKKPQRLTRFCLGTICLSSSGVEFYAHEKQQSFMLSPLVRSTAWAILPPGKEVLEAGEVVNCRFFGSSPEDECPQ